MVQPLLIIGRVTGAGIFNFGASGRAPMRPRRPSVGTFYAWRRACPYASGRQPAHRNSSAADNVASSEGGGLFNRGTVHLQGAVFGSNVVEDGTGSRRLEDATPTGARRFTGHLRANQGNIAATDDCLSRLGTLQPGSLPFTCKEDFCTSRQSYGMARTRPGSGLPSKRTRKRSECVSDCYYVYPTAVSCVTQPLATSSSTPAAR